MKHIKAFCLSIALLSIPSMCHAQELFAANISASLSTQVASGTNYTIHTVPITNATFINAVLKSGSYPGLKAKDFDVVLVNSSAEEVEVINTAAANAVVDVIAISGSNAAFNAIESTTGPKLTDLCTDTDYEFNIPNVEGKVLTSSVLKFTYSKNDETLENFLYSFVGASGAYSAGSVFLEGTIKKGTKVYY